MFDVTPLIFIGIDDTVKKYISGILYVYKCGKKGNNRKYENCMLIENSENVYFKEHLNKNKESNKNGVWNKYFCFIKANIFYAYEIKGDIKPSIVFLLEGVKTNIINFHLAVKQKLIEETEKFILGENADILQLTLKSQDDNYKYFLYTPEKGNLKRWFNSINNCNLIYLQTRVEDLTEENEALKEEIYKITKLKDLDLHNKEIEITDLKKQMHSLEANLEHVTTKNKRLQMAAEVNIKSTDEMLQKKISELDIIHKQLGQKIEENMRLEKEVKQAKEAESKTMHLLSSLEKEKKNITKKMNKILETYEDACDEPEKIALINFNINERYQKVVLNNKTLKDEVAKLNDRFFKLEDEYKEKIKTLKEVVEIGDVFDYLHKLIALCQTKIKYYEEGYKYDEKEEQKVKTTICNLIKETKVSETNARVCYIRHRSKVLEEKLNHYINRLPVSDYFYFACNVLRRLGWIFGEIEALNPLTEEDSQEKPFFMCKGDIDNFPLREQIYYNEGLEGRFQYNIVNDVDIYSFPKKMCPYQEKLISDNNYNYIKIKLSDIKKDFNILKKKEKPLTTNSVITDLRWEEIRKSAFDRLERNMLMLEKRTNEYT